MPSRPDLLAIGYVARAHGTRGEVRVHLHDGKSTAIYDAQRVWIGGKEKRLLGARPTTGGVLVTVEGIADRDSAHALRGQAVEVSRDDVPLGENEFFIADLVGCDAVDGAGNSLGRVAEVLVGPQTLLVLRDERVERLLPLVPEFLVSVDLEARRVVLSPPEDLPAEPIK